MFPTLSHLTEYLFGFSFRFPIQTFGLFEVLSFVFAYITFSSEFKRKEKLGLIHSFKREIVVGKPASLVELGINGILGFILGLKVIGVILNYSYFIYNPLDFIFSLKGNITGGGLLGVIFILATYIYKKRKAYSHPEVVEETVHPYQLMLTLTVAAAFWGFLGAKLFSIIENLDGFMDAPLSHLLSTSGWTFYGGLIFGALAYLFIGYKHGMKLIHLADIGSPGMLVSYGVGRIGCQLAGDGDWGIVNVHPKPDWLHKIPDWMWSFNFPHNVLNEGIPIDNCVGKYCSVLPYGVYPTSFYEAVVILLFFATLWMVRKKIKIPGLMFFLYLILNGGERFLIEQIRINPKYEVLGLSFTQAELIGMCMFLGGIVGLLWILFENKLIPLFSRKGDAVIE